MATGTVERVAASGALANREAGLPIGVALGGVGGTRETVSASGSLANQEAGLSVGVAWGGVGGTRETVSAAGASSVYAGLPVGVSLGNVGGRHERVAEVGAPSPVVAASIFLGNVGCRQEIVSAAGAATLTGVGFAPAVAHGVVGCTHEWIEIDGGYTLVVGLPLGVNRGAVGSRAERVDLSCPYTLGSPTGTGWSTDFTFQITNSGGIGDEDGVGADGIAFIIKGFNTDVLGDLGEGIGYDGIRNSLAVEFDTFNNGGSDGDDGNHVAVHSRGTLANSSGTDGRLRQAHVPARMNDDAIHHVRITYDDAGILAVYLDDMSIPKLAMLVSLDDLLDLSVGTMFGITSATGSGFGDHDILAWSMENDDLPRYVFSAPDFSSLAGFSLYGDAAQVSDRVRLAPAETDRTGSMFRVSRGQTYQVILV